MKYYLKDINYYKLENYIKIIEEELILKGEIYEGRFLGNKRISEYEAGSHYTTYLETVYFYKGKGVIKDLQLGDETKFLFNTRKTFKKSISFEDYIIFLERDDFSYPKKSNSFIIHRKPVLDLLLQAIGKKAKNNEKDDIIPSIELPCLKYEELIEKGLVSEDSGQIRFGFD